MQEYNLVVIDLDTLVACERHVEDHGCGLSDNIVYERSIGVADALTRIIEKIDSSKVWILVAPNTECSNMKRAMLEKYIKKIIESSTYNPIISIIYEVYFKLINLFSRGVLGEIDTYKDRKDIYIAINKFLGSCLSIRASDKCKSIESRVECIISRLGSPHSPDISYILFCSERNCDNIKKKYDNKIKCNLVYKSERRCGLKCKSKGKSIDVYILFIYSKKISTVNA